MRVAIDARWVQPKLRGMGRHVLNLLLGLSHRESDLEFLVFYNNPLARKLVERSGGSFRGRFHWIKAISRPQTLLEKAEIPWLLKIHDARLFHDVGGSGVRSGGVPTVVTIHELSVLRFSPSPDLGPVRRRLRRARLIIAVSQSLADEIENNLNVSRPKIRVISNAIDPWYTEKAGAKEIKATRERFRLPGPYFLCVTADRPSKNTDLVQQTARNWYREGDIAEQWVFTIPGADDGLLRYLDVVEDVWLRPLYAAAEALIVPSHYEGFSLPPLESLAAGSLPVVSDIPPHRETLEGIIPKTLFFDPTEAASLDRALRAVVEGGEPLRASVLENFRLVGDRYSFIETAQGVQAVYREALRG